MLTEGSHVVDRFKETNPDICVLDVMLPGKDGFTIGKEISATNPEMPIIFLTAKTQTNDLLKGFESGGNDFIRKPFSMEELIVRIENLLSLRGVSTSVEKDEYVIRSFRFRPGALELEREQQIIKLSHKENELLKLLVLGANESIDRSVILNKIWGDDHFFNSRNLDVYVAKLRGHFKPDPEVQIITLKGIGYRFVF
ncbi:UNVERIFIED_CONTAM: hypothetical protein GTU68_010006 [Idotea baltica]|nr:hypothetical protein [Idotea baltica]